MSRQKDLALDSTQAVTKEEIINRRTRKDFSSRRDAMGRRRQGRSLDTGRERKYNSCDDLGASRYLYRNDSAASDSNFEEESNDWVYDDSTGQESRFFEDGEIITEGEESDDNAIEANDLNTQVNELFRHIYNEEKDSIEKLQNLVFPQIENIQIDSYILQAIESSMNIVRDQLRTSIKETLCNTVMNKNKTTKVI